MLVPRMRMGRIWFWLREDGLPERARREGRTRERVPSAPMRRVPVATVSSVKEAVMVELGFVVRDVKVLAHCCG